MLPGNTARVWLLIVAGLLAMDLLGTEAVVAQTRADSSIARTTEGPVRGYVENGVRKFLGIPYAAPPIGALRWRPPAPPRRRRTLLQATAFANICPQVTALGVYAGPASITEDCLYLNIFVAAGQVGARGPMPVLVWLHGGGHMAGASNDYDGSKLAKGGPLGRPTVVVTLNNRLGLLGFLAHAALGKEGHPSGNFGLMDVQRALHWVQDNISAFGGDPSNITLGGQSAGAALTAALMLSPSGAKLFQRVILESGPLSVLPSLTLALQRGNRFTVAAGCEGSDPVTARCLRDLSVPQILQLQGRLNEGGAYLVGPMVDGVLIVQSPMEAWESGAFTRVPILGGTVHDEGQFAVAVNSYNNSGTPMSAAEFAHNVRTTYAARTDASGTSTTYPPDTADRILAEYPLSAYPTPSSAYAATVTDPIACRANKTTAAMSKSVPFYAYEFTYRDAPFYFPPLEGVRPLAAHTIDLQFLFPAWHGGPLGLNHTPQNSWATGEISGSEVLLSDQLVAYWTRFAATGNPNAAAEDAWPAFNSSKQYLDQRTGGPSTITEGQFRTDHRCEFWDTILRY